MAIKSPIEFLKESEENLSLYEISATDQKGKKSQKLLWAKDAESALLNAKSKGYSLNMKEVHARALNYEEIEKLNEKLQEDWKKTKEKIKALSTDYIELKKEAKSQLEALNAIKKPDEQIPVEERLKSLDQLVLANDNSVKEVSVEESTEKSTSDYSEVAPEEAVEAEDQIESDYDSDTNHSGETNDSDYFSDSNESEETHQY
jgi:hypothetical protein